MNVFMHAEAERFDVVVVGGGPAGSTVSALLARQGYRVVMLEKEQHPRFHIGESLLPCNLPLLEELGVMDQVRKLGTVKLGADFSLGDETEYRTYHFARSLNRTPPHAYEVTRAEFDEMLFRNAATLGADAREGITVKEVITGSLGCEVTAVNKQGERLTLRGRYLVDASGRDTLLSKKFGLKRKNMQHGSAAIFGHFKGVSRRPGIDQGNISIYWFEHGWAWMIPLAGDRMSVGCVCSPSYLKSRKGSTAEFLQSTLALMPAAAARMVGAEADGEVRATGNYSYTSTTMVGPGWMMVGDAFAFVDPVFSSGVYLAMNSAKLAAEAITTILSDPRREASVQRAYERRVQKGIRTFSWFIYRFTSPAMRWIFRNPRNAWRLEEAVISMLAGDVFDSEEVERRFGYLRGLYWLRTALEASDSLRNRIRRRRDSKTIFRAGTTPEGDPETVGFR